MRISIFNILTVTLFLVLSMGCQKGSFDLPGIIGDANAPTPGGVPLPPPTLFPPGEPGALDPPVVPPGTPAPPPGVQIVTPMTLTPGS